ncbi:lipopolysaccharide heptosyltransferase family protein [Geovibrio thiophilus]|uniref:Lipopolysaccharide heptosyltransferase family protein n=1 Tax=Geovibrio thiophilus TaxID=139438 RepID=A0A3R5UVB0_9BACT|nr:glycosyltransferase family 9 protein [Geovibrio thiophilus]QAR33569.1 lipopolysaccharide heptosyltransferase family protein [Geovibrio thiophilus]
MKFLLIQLYQTGDVVLTTHIPREIKKIYPDSEIDFLTFQANKPVLENSQYLRNIITTDRKSGLKGFLKSIIQIRRNRYDAVLDFMNNPRTALMSFFSGAEKTVGYATSRRKRFYNTLAPRLGGRPGETKLSLLAPFINDFRPENHNTRPELFTSDSADIKAAEVLHSFGIKDSDFIVTMSPTHKRDTRRWKIRHFMDTAVFLTGKYNAKVILTYGPGEKEYILNNVPMMPENVFLMPQLSLGEFTALIKRAKLHIGNDSAPHHIATAFKIPTFIIIGSSHTSWVFNSPEHTYITKGLDCQPCGKSVCAKGEEIPCMENLTADDIMPALERFINNAVRL